MTGVGETFLPLSLPIMPCRDGQPLRSGADQGRVHSPRLAQRRIAGGLQRRVAGPAWPEAGASVEDWIEALAEVANDLEAPAMRIQPVIGEVLRRPRRHQGARLARMSGSGATCFAIYENTPKPSAAAQKIQGDHSGWWVHAGVLS